MVLAELRQQQENTVSWVKRPLVGDIGRFTSENPQLPRFVVVRVTDSTVVVWYSGSSTKTEVPWQTFIRKCIATWEVTIASEIPAWLKPGVSFQLDQAVTLFRIRHPASPGTRSWTDHEGHLDVSKFVLKVFSLRLDHAACFVPDLKTFVLVPLKTIAEHGCLTRTIWDILTSEDDPFEDAESDFREWAAKLRDDDADGGA